MFLSGETSISRISGPDRKICKAAVRVSDYTARTMEDNRSKDTLTRRAALMVSAASMPLLGQSQAVAHPVVHFEIGCRDVARTEQFYGNLFGWQTKRNGPASNITTGGRDGIGGHITSLGHEPHHYTIFYVEVEDVQTYLDKATALGGKVVVPPVKIPTGTFAWFSDVDGNTVGLIKSNR